ncbi:MAG: mechanosensitive ion channel [Phycisphaeraceae bacterium]|nr:mechanosensitive ion channel [Phycisphaeraceae bacterium]MCW5753522.1 mechanosensitive ion channel [Phycisphaeraceae bacterium]
MEQLTDWITNPEKLATLLVDAGTAILKVLLIMIASWLIGGWAKNMVVRGLTRAKIDITLSKFFGNVAKWAILIFGIMAAMEVLRVQTTGMAAVLAGASLAIGLAFQGSLGNIAAGVMLLVFRPFRVGDVVNVAGVTGRVDEIELFTTTIDTFDNRRFVISNGSIFGNTIENITYHPQRRVDVPVGIEYSADIDKTREALLSATTRVKLAISDPPPAVILDSFGDSSVNWIVRVWTKTPDFWPCRQETIRAVKMSLDEAGIGIPFPQRDLHFAGPLEIITRKAES